MRGSFVVAVLVLVLVGCGGSNSGGGGAVPNGPAGDPVGAVNGFISALKAKAYDNLGKLVCAAKQDDILGSVTGPGANRALFDAMTFDIKDLKVEQKSATGDSAVVHVSGTISTTIDPAKGRDVVRQLFGASMPSGAQVTDQQVDQFITSMNTRRPIDSDVDVVKENGGWVVCSDLSGSTD